MKALLTALFLLCLSTAPSLAAEPADSGETEDGCPTVYGTWRTAYVEDDLRFMNPIPLENYRPLPPLLPLEVIVKKDKAILTYASGRQETFVRVIYKNSDKDKVFSGKNKYGNGISMGDSYDKEHIFPNEKCIYTFFYFRKSDDISSVTRIVHMTLVK